MIKKSKFTAVVLSAVFAASLIAGCGNSASSDSTDTTSETETDTAANESASDSEDTASSGTEKNEDSDLGEDTLAESDSNTDDNSDSSDGEIYGKLYQVGETAELKVLQGDGTFSLTCNGISDASDQLSDSDVQAGNSMYEVKFTIEGRGAYGSEFYPMTDGFSLSDKSDQQLSVGDDNTVSVYYIGPSTATKLRIVFAPNNVISDGSNATFDIPIQ